MNNYFNRSTWLAMTLSGWLAMSLHAHAASFDCAKAGTKVEKMICDSNFSLKKRDEDLDAAYQWALMRTENKKEVTREQRHWLKTVRNACKDIGCLLRAYDARNEELATQARGKGCYALMPIFDGGLRGNVQPIEPVCLALEKNLNQFCDQPPMACGLKIAPEFRDQIVLPKWTPLDPKSNLALIEEFIRAPWQDNSNDGSDQRRWEENRPDIEKALAENRLSFSQAKLDLYNLGKAQAVYRLGYSDCEANNPQLSDQKRWDEKINPASVQIHYAPEVVRPLFKQYFLLQKEPLYEVFLYEGKVYDFGMAGSINESNDKPFVDNRLGVGRLERWEIPGDRKINIHIVNVCQFNYQPTQGETK